MAPQWTLAVLLYGISMVLAVNTCSSGLSGMSCGMCASDAACSAITKGNRCVKSLQYVPDMQTKTYDCIMSQTLQAVFSDGAMALHCIKGSNNTCAMAVFKNATGITGEHAVDCTMGNCTFSGTSFTCSGLICKCTDLCSSLSKTIFEVTMFNKSLTVTTEGSTINVAIVGSPLPLGGACTASSCETAAVYNQVMGGSGSGSGSSKPKPSEKFSTALIIALTCVVAVAGAIAIVAGSFYSSYHVQLRKTAVLERSSSLEDPLSVAPLTTSTSPNISEKLEFFDITCTTVPKSRPFRKNSTDVTPKACTILHKISGSVHRGQVLGLMGPSGSGKTTLLNALAGVANGTTLITGQLALDSLPLPPDYRRLAAYVHQDDNLITTLTVRESMEYSAFLRLPCHWSLEAKQQMVNRVLDELRLTHVAESTIGSATSGVRGISGGERRRLSIGMELVTSPSILFLDEPTSGLDSSSANSLVAVLQALAKNGRMVIMSIHQPSTKSFLKLDKVLLLAKGKVMYNGASKHAADYFHRNGLPCPVEETIADHLLDVVSDADNVESLHKLWLDHHQAIHEPSSSSFINTMSFEMLQAEAETPDSPNTKKTTISRLFELQILFVRATRTLIRNKSLVVFHLLLSLILGLVAGGIFSGLQLNLAGFQNRTGSFYFVLTFFGFATLSSMDVFIKERSLFFKEAGAKYYSPLSYFLSKTLLDLFSLRIIPAILFASVFYYIMGLNPPADRFLLFTSTLVLFNVAAGSLSLFISTVSKTVGIANLIATVVLLIMLLFGGFLLNVQTMPKAVAPLQWLSLFKYAFEVMMTNELQGLLLSFDAPGYPAVPIYGEVFLKTIGQDVNNQVQDICCLIGFIIVLNIASYIALSLQVPKQTRLHMAPGGQSPIPILSNHAADAKSMACSSTVSLNAKID
ncbi:ATP-binding Cassette (ABC) Superfamily [Thraustotheca clavata]|uniref:ATP-binding Cassette (ABC) Superfamily n=1 Tax=Thraustotheca clavata TaxID=74557 RepID=A0A1W0A2X3_9STRA|nr:ATP-binding Cassette (ABC) Superfamily [Thraustotheca clavata]